MTASGIIWRFAQHPRDQDALSSFECTCPPARATAASGWKKVHPRPAEEYAQRSIRGLRTGRDNRKKRAIWVGEDSDGIVAVLAWEWQEGDHVHLNVAGIAERRRGEAGHPVSSQMMDTAFQQLAGEADDNGMDHLIVTATIHQDNRASEALAERQGMACHDAPGSRPDGYRLWSVALSW